MWNRFKVWLARPVNGGSLAVFRIAVGLIMALEAYSLLRPSASTGGRIMLDTYYTGADVTFHFLYAWFEWLPVLPKGGMYLLVGALALAALMMMVGFCYRLAASVVFLAWGYLYAIESTRTYWMSYYYLELIVTFLLIWMPAANCYSIDAWLGRRGRPASVPLWTIFLLRAQLVVTYFFAGLAKVNADWMFDAVPVRDFLARAPVLSRYGAFFSASQAEGIRQMLRSDGLACFLSYAGLFFDLAVGWLLLFRRTRIPALVLLILFHATNHFLLFDDIVWFPLLGVLTATIFLEPDWPERAQRWFGRTKINPAAKASSSADAPVAKAPAHALVAALVVFWLSLQILLPLRHFFIPGDGRITWEGLSFCWRLKAEIYRVAGCEIALKDPDIISTNGSGKTELNWTRWKGESVIYRRVATLNIDWTTLPEVFVSYEPEIGERIIYNPLAGSAGGHSKSEPESEKRLAEIWQELYGHTPKEVKRTVSLERIIEAYTTAVMAKGGALKGDINLKLAEFLRAYGVNGNRKGIATLRRTLPFALEKAPAGVAPFLVVEDASLYQQGPTGLPMVNRSVWKPNANPAVAEARYANNGASPMVIYLAEFDTQDRSRLPAVCVMDELNRPQGGPFISWDPLRDLSVSKFMHVSTNPFLLRRYARRVAALWEKGYGRKPAVFATARVSLNGRDPQPIVDSSADLASVPVSHWRHNPWIRDLVEKRIPKDSQLAQGAQISQMNDPGSARQ